MYILTANDLLLFTCQDLDFEWSAGPGDSCGNSRNLGNSFCDSPHIAITSTGYIYVADSYNGAVKTISRSGNNLTLTLMYPFIISEFLLSCLRSQVL